MTGGNIIMDIKPEENNIGTIQKEKHAVQFEFAVKHEGLPEKCQICKQTDCFDPHTNFCSRCAGMMQQRDTTQPLLTHPYSVTAHSLEELQTKIRNQETAAQFVKSFVQAFACTLNTPPSPHTTQQRAKSILSHCSDEDLFDIMLSLYGRSHYFMSTESHSFLETTCIMMLLLSIVSLFGSVVFGFMWEGLLVCAIFIFLCGAVLYHLPNTPIPDEMRTILCLYDQHCKAIGLGPDTHYNHEGHTIFPYHQLRAYLAE